MARAETTLREVSLTQARNLSPLFDEAVRHEHPVLIVRNRREWGLLLSHGAMVRVLAPYQFHAHVLPEEDNGFTLWIDELDIGAHGRTPSEASRELLAAVGSYVKDYREQFDFYRHLPDRARLEPYVLRLSLARDDAELLEMLFPSALIAEAEPLHKAAG